jgi:hypothetical protein
LTRQQARRTFNRFANTPQQGDHGMAASSSERPPNEVTIDQLSNLLDRKPVKPVMVQDATKVDMVKESPLWLHSARLVRERDGEGDGALADALEEASGGAVKPVS